MVINSNFIDDLIFTQSRFSSSLESGLVETRIVRNQLKQIYIGKHVAGVAYVRDSHNSLGDKLLIEFEGFGSRIRQSIIYRRDLALARCATEIFSSLFAQGYSYDPKKTISTFELFN